MILKISNFLPYLKSLILMSGICYNDLIKVSVCLDPGTKISIKALEHRVTPLSIGILNILD